MQAPSRLRFFTLLEMLLAIFLISIASGAIGFNAYAAIQEERFQQSAQILVKRLQLAQDIMMYYDLDSSLNIYPDKKGSVLSAKVLGVPSELEVSENMRENLAKICNTASETVKLKNIYVFWENEKERSLETDIHMLFSASGEKMPQGALYIRKNPNREEKGDLSLYLRGSPRRKYTLAPPKNNVAENEEDLIYPTKFLPENQ